MGLTQVSTSGIKDATVATADIADQAITLAKLPHGDGSSDGKFLRANNGADPSFETVTSTTINNNADNRIITGSGTANTLNGESSVVIDSNGQLGVGTTSPGQLFSLKAASGQCQQSLTSATDQSCAIYFGDTDSVNRSVILHNNSDDSLAFNVAASERMRIDSSGNVGIGVVPQTGQYSGYNHLQVGESATLSSNDTQADTNVTNLSNNAYLNANASAWKYLHTDEATLYQTHSGNHHFYIAPSGNQDNTISFAERFAVRNDGVTFNGDTAAANALNDYEEGTWTPANANFSTYSSVTWDATYIKIGKLVFFNAVQTGGDTDWGISQSLSGLPFAVAKTGAGSWTNNAPSEGGSVLIWDNEQLYFAPARGSVSSGHKLRISGVYETS